MNTRIFLTSLAFLSITIGSIAFASQNAKSERSFPSLCSPNQSVIVTLSEKENALFYEVEYNGKTIIRPSKSGLALQGVAQNAPWRLVKLETSAKNQTWENRFGKKRTYTDNFTQIALTYKQDNSDLSITYIFRAYDDGVAFRYKISQGDICSEYVVTEDLTQYVFAEDYDLWTSIHPKFNTSQEKTFEKVKLSQISENAFAICPVVVESPDFCAAITEADLYDWAGAQFASAKEGSAALKTRLTPRKDNNGCVVFKTPAESPWKVILLGKKPVDLINNSGVILNVSKPCQIEDASWIKPGPSAWDWWTGGNRVMNTETTKDKIDLAAEMGWAYMTIDDPWYYSSRFKQIPGEKVDTTRGNGNINLEEVFQYAKDKGIGICLWLHYQDLLECGVENTFRTYQKWGISGVKIDFMDSDNQETVNWINQTAECGAKYHLMVNYHGMYKPTGLERAFPNQITREGVLGNEYNKWTDGVKSKHEVTLPFTRFLCGPADFTPGGMLNCQPEQFVRQNNMCAPPTHVIGTRAHELAVCILYDSPLMTLCDSPENYRKAQGAEILKNLPSAWDNTYAVEGEIGEFLVQYRLKGDTYYAGAITNDKARTYQFKLDFLPADKTYSAMIVSDTAESSQNAKAVEVKTIDVTSDSVLTINMVRNGGWCAKFELKK